MKKTGFIYELKKNRMLFIMLIPAFVLVLVFSYIPMSGLVLAFKKYNIRDGIFGSAWCGFDNFKFFFVSGKGFRVTMNTIVFNLINLVTSQFLAMLLAVVITEMNGRFFKKISQSILFLPYFISWIIVGAFVYNIFNYESGVLNHLLDMFGQPPVNMYRREMSPVWICIIVFFNSWKWAGYNSVIYTAAITGVDQERYEAAAIDGANIFQRIIRIMIPSVKPTIIVMLLLNVSRILRGDFQMFYQIIGDNSMLFGTTDVIDTYVFRSLAAGANLEMTTAAAFYQSILCFIIIVAVNGAVKHIDKDYALF